MQRVLVANSDIEQNKKICQYLAKDKRLDIIETIDGTSTLKKYNELKPNILVLDSCLKDISCIDIIDKLSTTYAEKRICNIIITAKKDELLKLSNNAKVYKTFYGIDNLSDLSDTIDELYAYGNYEELTPEDFDFLFMKLRIPLNSTGSEYLRESITEGYYFPTSEKVLNNIFSIIAEKYDRTNESIRSGIRTALENMNLYKNTIDYPIMKNFELEENITPKDFLEKSVAFLHTQKRKKK